MVDTANSWGEPLHPERSTAEKVVRVVLAEAALAPGPLHYLLEGEGFQVLGSAADDDDLARILAQSLHPEVIVVDAAVPATVTAVAHEFAPDAELVVIWPEGVTPPPRAEQVLPETVYQDLGTAVWRAADRHRLRRPVDDEPLLVVDDATPPSGPAEATAVAARRSAARVLVGTVALIFSIVVTMGVSFALEGWRASHLATPRTPTVTTPSTASGTRSSPGALHGTQPSKTTTPGCAASQRRAPNDHASDQARRRASDCPSRSGGGNGTNQAPTNGPGTNLGGGAGQGGGSGGQGSGHGSGQGSQHGASGSHAPSDHPTGAPSSPPAAGDHAGPKD